MFLYTITIQIQRYKYPTFYRKALISVLSRLKHSIKVDVWTVNKKAEW